METYTYTRAELLAAGLVVNPHVWIGSGWMYCPTCKAYRYHAALSHDELTDCFEVCRECETYTGRDAVPELEHRATRRSA